MRKVLVLTATTALMAGMAGTAYATSYKATELVQKENGNCGRFEEGKPIIGSAKFTRTENKLKVTYKAKGLAPLTTYEFEFYNASPCELIATSGSLTTNAKGAGSVTAEIAVPEKDAEFFVDVLNFGASPFGADSFIATLPKP